MFLLPGWFEWYPNFHIYGMTFFRSYYLLIGVWYAPVYHKLFLRVTNPRSLILRCFSSCTALQYRSPVMNHTIRGLAFPIISSAESDTVSYLSWSFCLAAIRHLSSQIPWVYHCRGWQEAAAPNGGCPHSPPLYRQEAIGGYRGCRL